MVTKEYHRAQNAYKRERKDKGIEVNAEDMKTYVSKKVAKFKSDVAPGLIDIDIDSSRPGRRSGDAASAPWPLAAAVGPAGRGA